MATTVKIKTLPRVLLGLAAAALVLFTIRYFIHPPAAGEAVVPKQASLAEVRSTSPGTASTAVALPSTTPATVPAPEMRLDVMAWNAQMGLMFANGGARTTQGSLMQKHGANLTITREDDTNKMAAALTAFASALKSNSNPQPSTGVHFVIVMGDGTAAFLSGLNGELSKLGKEYEAEIVGAVGYSRGEDKFMGQAAWKENPKTARGCLVAGVLRDGDWNITMKWAGDNGIKNNPDEKTYDADAINWMAADDFLDAPAKYIAGACDDRRVVSGGKPTGETKHVCVNGVVTWTPGDVNVATKKGGLVSIVSTKEYSSQMPAAVIGIRKWDAANKAEVVAMLAAAYEGGDQVKTFPAALQRAAQASVQVYKEQDAAYWAKYYKGETEADATGVSVELGGSLSANLADAEELFGLSPGSANIYAATYTVFGDIVVQQYPKLVGSYPKADDVINTSFVRAVMASSTAPAGVADRPQFNQAPVTNVVSKRNWSINFQTGQASFTPDAQVQLTQLKNGLLVADDLAIEVHGYTDNTGDPTANMSLSQARASAVKNWLEKQSSTNFPETRFTVVPHGQNDPVASNASPAGQALNRRVTIILGTN